MVDHLRAYNRPPRTGAVGERTRPEGEVVWKVSPYVCAGRISGGRRAVGKRYTLPGRISAYNYPDAGDEFLQLIVARGSRFQVLSMRTTLWDTQAGPPQRRHT